MTWGSEGTRYYVNGYMVDANTLIHFPYKHAGKIYLGGKHNYYSDKMSMADLRIYNQPLSSYQIEMLFAMGDKNLKHLVGDKND